VVKADRPAPTRAADGLEATLLRARDSTRPQQPGLRRMAAAGCLRRDTTPASARRDGFRRFGLPAVAHEAVYDVPRRADAAFARQEAAQGAGRQTGTKGGKRHDARVSHG
jgi:hypothetical protein